MTTTTTPATAVPAETAPTDAETIAKLRWIGRALLSVGAITAVADWLLFDLRPGLGWSIFFAAVWGAILLNRDLSGYRPRPRDLLVAVGMVLTLLQFSIRASFSGGLCLVVLTVWLAGHLLYSGQHPWWRRFVEQGMAVCVAPLRWMQASYWLSMAGWRHAKPADRGERQPPAAQIGRWIGILAPSAVLAVFFLFLLGKGNAILGEALGDAAGHFSRWLLDVRLPSLSRVVFWGFVATVSLGLLWRSGKSRVLRWLDRLSATGEHGKSAPLADAFSGIWRMRMVLIVVNLIYFAANTIDVSYLWSGHDLPAGMTISKFVHSGTYSLIASVILAAVVISVLFQQHAEITRARGQRLLAMVWVAQNLLLLGNVLLRVKFYVDAYQLSVLRLHLGLFLALVAVGFVLLAIRVVQGRGFVWLAGANLLAVFLTFFLVQFWDTRETVARYNVAQTVADPAKPLDLYFLREMGPSAWSSILAIANGDAPLPGYREEATELLEEIRYSESQWTQRDKWQEWQLFRSQMREKIGVVSQRADQTMLP